MSQKFEQPAFKREFLGALKVGMFLEEACRLTMVDPKEFGHWKKAAAEGREPYASFIRQCERAEAQSIRRALGTLQRQGSKDWRAGMELLKRRFGVHWNRSFDTMDADQARKLDELDLTPSGVQSSLDELEALGGNVVPIRRAKRGPQKSGRVREGGDGGDQRAVHPGPLAEAAGGGADGGGVGA